MNSEARDAQTQKRIEKNFGAMVRAG